MCIPVNRAKHRLHAYRMQGTSETVMFSPEVYAPYNNSLENSNDISDDAFSHEVIITDQCMDPVNFAFNFDFSFDNDDDISSSDINNADTTLINSISETESSFYLNTTSQTLFRHDSQSNEIATTIETNTINIEQEKNELQPCFKRKINHDIYLEQANKIPKLDSANLKLESQKFPCYYPSGINNILYDTIMKEPKL